MTITTHDSGNNASATQITVALPTYTANDYLIVFVSRNQTTALTFGANVTATSLADASGRLAAYRIVPDTLSETSFTIDGSSAVWTWSLIKVTNVNAGATVASSTNAIGTNSTSSLEYTDTTLGYTSAGTELAFFVAGVNATATWTTTADTVFNTTANNAAMMVSTKSISSGLTSVSYTASNRGNNGSNRLETSLTFVLQEAPPVSVSLNSPADASSDSDTTPTLDFTGTDHQGDPIRYQIQISPKNFDNIVRDTSGGASASSVSSITQSVTVASGNNRKLIAVVCNNDAGASPQAPSGVTYGGVALTKVADQSDVFSSENNISFWELNAPAVGTANLVATSAGTFQFVDMGWIVFQNASQTLTQGAGRTFANTQNPAVKIPCPVYGSWALSAAYPTNVQSGGVSGATEFLGAFFPDAGYSGSSTSDGVATHTYSGSAATEDWTTAWLAVLPAYADGLIQGISGESSGLSDNFDDNSIHSKWTTYIESSGAIAETSQQLQFTLAATTANSWSGIYSDTPIDFRGCYVQMEVVSATSGDTWLDLTLSSTALDADDFFSIGLDVSGVANNAGTPALVAFEVNAATGGTVLAAINYNSSVHKFLRMREFGGLIYWDWSTDNSSWTNFYSKSPNIDPSSVYVVIDDYEYSSNTSPSVHIVDNFVIGAWQGGAFVNPDTGADTDPFNSGENIQYTVQSPNALDVGTYYWRVRGKDPAGLNTYGAWSSTRSFEVTTSGTNMQINIGDSWKAVAAAKINIGDSWKDVVAIKQNIGDSWKTVF